MAENSKYTVGWICAVSTEYTAARAFLDDIHEHPHTIPVHNPDAYTLGRMGKHNVVIAVLADGDYGLSSAAVVAQRMLSLFPNIRMGLMVGIGGGAPTRSPDRDIRLGDVVVSSPSNGHPGVIQYDFGKQIQDQEFKITRSLNLPPEVLRTAVSKMKTSFDEKGNCLPQMIEAALSNNSYLRDKYGRPPPETDRLFRSHFVFNPANCESINPDILVPRLERKVGNSPAVFYGLIASANLLLKDARIRDKFAADSDVLCFEMEAAGIMNHFPSLIIRGICDYSDSHKNKRWQGYAAMAAAAYAKILLSHVLPTAVEVQRPLADIIKNGLQPVTEAVSKVAYEQALSHLSIAKEALYDSKDNQRDGMCFPSTRVELLDQISRWAQNSDRQRIYWLSGMAGTGKSTISRTFAAKCDERKTLAASFFFRRGEINREDASLFFSTIVRQLFKRRLDIRQAIIDAIQEDQEISSKSNRHQFEQLLENPLQKALTQWNGESQILIIDALDECKKDEDVEDIVALVSQLAEQKSFGIKVFISSRPDFAPKSAFGSINRLCHEVSLQQTTMDVIDRDIGVYLDFKLSSIRDDWNKLHFDRQVPSDWPQTAVITALVKKARPLFIFAATLCRFVENPRRGSPLDLLKHFLALTGQKRVGASISSAYWPVLEDYMKSDNEHPSTDSDHAQKFRRVVGPIIILHEPLRIKSLSCLITVDETEIYHVVDLLRSVLDVSDGKNPLVRVFHTSFRDFLVGVEKANFKIDPKNTHKTVALACIRLLMDGKNLTYNMCSLQPGDECPDLDTQIMQDRFPSHMRYACVHLVEHLKQSEAPLKDGGEVHRFLETKLLYWIEALVILRKSSMIMNFADTLISLVDISTQKRLYQFMEDIRAFIRRHISTFADHPLQLYWSALPFSPSNSIVRNIFSNHLPMECVSGLGSQWTAFRILYMDGLRHATSMALSPDCEFIACGFELGSVAIWSLPTGELIQTFDDTKLSKFTPTKSVWGQRSVSLTFSSDSKQLVSASPQWIFIFTLNDGHTWTMSHVNMTKSKLTLYVDASHHSAEFASAHTDCTVGVWSMSADHKPRWLQVPGLKRQGSTFSLTKPIKEEDLDCIEHVGIDALDEYDLQAAVGFSRDSKLIAGFFRVTNATHIWSAADGRYLYQLPADHFSGIFLASSMVPSITREDGRVDVFDIMQDDRTGGPSYMTLWPPASGSERGQIAVSYASLHAAFRSGYTVVIWCFSNARALKKVKLSALLEDHDLGLKPIPQPNLMFSSDGQYLVLAAEASIGIWSMSALDEPESTSQEKETIYVESLQSHDNTADSILASNESLIVTETTTDLGDLRINVWSTMYGRLVQTFESVNSYADVHLSPDSQYLSISNRDGFHRVLFIGNGEFFTMNEDLPVPSITRRNHPRRAARPAFSLSPTLIGACGPHGVVLYEVYTRGRLCQDPLGEAPIRLSQHEETLMYCAAIPNSDLGLMVVRYYPKEDKREEVHHFVNQEYVLEFSPDLSWTLFESNPEGDAGILQLRKNDSEHHFQMRPAEGFIRAAFSEDSSLLAETGSFNNAQINIWSLHTGPALIHTIMGQGCYGSFSFSRNNMFLDLGCYRISIKSALERFGIDFSSTADQASEWHGFSMGKYGKWMMHGNREMIKLPREWTCYLADNMGLSRAGDRYLAWITPTKEFFMVRFSETWSLDSSLRHYGSGEVSQLAKQDD